MGKKLVYILVAVALLAAAFYIGFQFFDKQGVWQREDAKRASAYLYENTKYGFQILFPKEWEVMKSYSTGEDTDAFESDYVYFALPTSDPQWQGVTINGEDAPNYADVFAITVWDAEFFLKERERCIEKPELGCPDESEILGGNDKYVFEVAYSPQMPEDVRKFVGESDKASDFLKDKFSITVNQAPAVVPENESPATVTE